MDAWQNTAVNKWTICMQIYLQQPNSCNFCHKHFLNPQPFKTPRTVKPAYLMGAHMATIITHCWIHSSEHGKLYVHRAEGQWCTSKCFQLAPTEPYNYFNSQQTPCRCWPEIYELNLCDQNTQMISFNSFDTKSQVTDGQVKHRWKGSKATQRE